MSTERAFTSQSPENKRIEDLASEYPESLSVQSKLIKTINTGNIVGEEVPIISEEEREEFLRRLAYKEISNDSIALALGAKDKKEYLSNLTTGKDVDSAVKIKENLQLKGSRRIFLNLLLSRPPENLFSVTEVMKVLDIYPTLDLFEELINKVAFKLTDMNTLQIREHSRRLEIMLYGEKEVETWEQFKLLKQEAESKYGKTFEESGIKIRELSKAETEEAFSMIEVHGDPWQEAFLKPEDLEKAGLGPKLRVEVGGKSILFSSVLYELGEGRVAAVGYVPDQERLVARSFYRSNSHGVWKYLPKYRSFEGKLEWFEKGYGEESISLPIPFQRALAYIDQESPRALILENPKFILVGTAREINKVYGNGEERNTYQVEVKEKAHKLDGNFYPKRLDIKVKPETADFFDREQAPNFSEPIYKWQQHTSTYGVIDIEVFTSKNKKLRYMFCKDKLGRVWIGGIELNSQIGSTGLRENWVDSGDLTTPAYQYESESAGYKNKELQSGNYVDMYKNYLSKIPVIQEYIKINRKRK